MQNPDDRFDIADEIKTEILSLETCVIMLVGGSDTGKTTLAEQLADWLVGSGPVAIVDADVGQSHIGPPTAVAWGLVKERFSGWDAIKPEAFYFVGATSPCGHLLSTVVGATLMCEEARSNARFVIVDTTGLVAGSVGRVLKWSKIDAIRPDVVVAIERTDELEAILAPYRHTSSPAIVRMRPPEAVRLKTVEQRAAHRNRLFARYFADSSVVELDANRVSVRCTDTLPEPGTQYLTDRLVSLRDGAGRDIALGVFTRLDDRPNLVAVRTPLRCREHVRTIVVGDIRISPDGEELKTDMNGEPMGHDTSPRCTSQQ